ncbi:EamA family transporter [Saccharopolyspora sp. WRP15-2]|uniref:EamA family transporter n=1 Tax=Saccharopolyspora oryzae TaxID=2997343 RepID=A0ABT4USA9_9PSEU|nr:EamA family transporter [Saccharopolyspora oryzae]MDA3623994.1 EamA family transporter [Saccharopolyspora oryzae]
MKGSAVNIGRAARRRGAGSPDRTVFLLLALSWTSAGAAVFLVVFDSLVGFMLYTRLLESAPAPLVSTYAYVTPLVGAAIGATAFGESLWAGAFAGGALVLGAVALELRGR